MSVRLPSSPSDVFLSVVLVGCQVLSIPLAMIRRAILWRRRPLLVWLSAPPHRVRPASALRLQDLLADRHGRRRATACALSRSRWATARRMRARARPLSLGPRAGSMGGGGTVRTCLRASALDSVGRSRAPCRRTVGYPPDDSRAGAWATSRGDHRRLCGAGRV